MTMTVEEKQGRIAARSERLILEGYRFDKGHRTGVYIVTPPGKAGYTVTLYVDGIAICSCPTRSEGACKHALGLRYMIRAVSALDNGLAPREARAWASPEAFIRARELDFG